MEKNMKKLQISDKLKERLAKIDSPIIRYILDIEEVDINNGDYINYLDVSRDNPEFISYMNKNKLDKFEDKEVVEQIPDPEFPGMLEIKLKRNILLSTLLNVQYLRLTNKRDFRIFISGVSGGIFLKGIEEENVDYNYSIYWRRNENSEWWSNNYRLNKEIYSRFKSISIPTITKITNPVWEPANRLHGKVSKTLRKLVPENMFSDKEWEMLSTGYKIESFKFTGFEDKYVYSEVKGESIQRMYHGSNYSNSNHDLGNSCMRYDSCEDYFNIYTKNPDNVSLAVITEGEDMQVAGRALLWKRLEGKAVDKVYFDRIYANSNSLYLGMKSHLLSLGYTDLWEIAGAHLRNDDYAKVADLSLKIEHADFEYYPYTDSFRFLTLNPSGGGVLSTKSGDMTLNSTEGGWEEKEGGSCDCCGTSNSDLHYIERGSHRRENLCDDCSVYSEYYDEYIAESDAVETEHDGYVLLDGAVRGYDMEWMLSDNAVLLYDSSFAHVDDDQLMESIDGSRFIVGDENFVEIAGDWYHKDNDDVAYDDLTDEWMLQCDYDDLMKEREDEADAEAEEAKEQESEVEEKEQINF